MPLEFTYLNFRPIAAVNWDNRKAMRKYTWPKTKFGKSTKNDRTEFRKTDDKMEIKF